MGFLTKTRDTFLNKKEREGRKGGREKGREGTYKYKKCVVLTSLIVGKDGPVTLPPS